MIGFIGGCKILTRNVPGVNDYRFFSKSYIKPSGEFHAFARDTARILLDSLLVRSEEGFKRLPDLLNELGSTACMVIKNDTILFEYYRKDYSDSAYVTSFSIAKAITCSLLGISIAEGKVKSLDEPIINYLPELASIEGMNRVTVYHLASMTSGLAFTRKKNRPVVEAARAYYEEDLSDFYLSHVWCEYTPGTRYRYLNGNTQLLALILERVYGKRMSELLEEKIWSQLGMKSEAIWSTDSKKNGLVKAFCCLNATPDDFARFGRLYIENGNWNGKQILSPDWVRRTLVPSITYGPERDYHFHWITVNTRYPLFVAAGLFNQMLLIYPKEKIIIVHFCKKHKRNAPLMRSVFTQLIDQLCPVPADEN